MNPFLDEFVEEEVLDALEADGPECRQSEQQLGESAMEEWIYILNMCSLRI